MSETTANTPEAPIPAAPAAKAVPTAAPVATPAPAAVPATPAEPEAPLKLTAKPMRLGVVPFLNAQPLVWGLQDHHKLFPVPPSQMGQLLKEGKLDVAIAPIAAYLLNPGLTIVPIAAIGCKGPVKSVRILSNGPLVNVERLFVDARSQTSVLLAKLILKRWYGVKKLEVEHVDMATYHPNQTKPWEAVLQFGDSALLAAPTGMVVTDLGEEWFFRTQKPFVFAVWMARSVPIAREIENDLLASKNAGLKHLDDVVNNYHGIWTFLRPQLKQYLEKNIDYSYTPAEVKGQLEFQKLLKEEGLIL